jgi:hypothetical protein
MRYGAIKDLKDEDFRRLTGVKKSTFNEMIEILDTAEKEKKKRGGSPNKISLPDRVLMTLEYLREYRTYFHIASSYGISESACYRNIVWIENTLIKHPTFHLPGKKELRQNDSESDIIMVDVTESPIQRPKKNSADTTLARKKSTP